MHVQRLQKWTLLYTLGFFFFNPSREITHLKRRHNHLQASEQSSFASYGSDKIINEDF